MCPVRFTSGGAKTIVYWMSQIRLAMAVTVEGHGAQISKHSAQGKAESE
jgi:hypothetical protein